MNSIATLSPAQLRKAADIQERIQSLQEELGQLLSNKVSTPEPTDAPKKRKKVSAAGRARMKAAQKARWAKIKGTAPSAKPAKKARKKISAAVRKARSEAMKARWAKAKTAGKTKL